MVPEKVMSGNALAKHKHSHLMVQAGRKGRRRCQPAKHRPGPSAVGLTGHR